MLGRPQKSIHADLLSELRKQVAGGGVSSVRSVPHRFAGTAREQNAPEESRLTTATIVDELSLGVALCDENERISTEIYYLLGRDSAANDLPPLRDTAWVKLPYILGTFHPIDTAFSPAEERVVQKAFIDHLWTHRLSDMVTMLGRAPDLDWHASASRLNLSNAAHADSIRTFAETYLAEIGGALELFVGLATDIAEARFWADADPTIVSTMTRRDREVVVHRLLIAIAEEGKAAQALPTVHVPAKVHAAIRHDKRRKLKGNDLLDFHHAVGALVYCNAFFTDGPLRLLLISNPAALDRDFPCTVVSDESDALAYVEALGARGVTA